MDVKADVFTGWQWEETGRVGGWVAGLGLVAVPFTRSGRLPGCQDVGFLFIQCFFYAALLSPYNTDELVAIFLKYLRTKNLTYTSCDCRDGLTGGNIYPNSSNCIR